MRSLLVCSVVAELFAGPAFAHPAVSDASFESGVVHSLADVDRASLTVLVGLWAALVGGRALWALPAIFMTAISTDFAAAVAGLRPGLVDPAIAISAAPFGLLAALRVGLSLHMGVAIVETLAFLFGDVCGADAAAGDRASYAVGFTLSIASLHAAGIVLGLSVRRLAARAAAN